MFLRISEKPFLSHILIKILFSGNDLTIVISLEKKKEDEKAP